MVTATHLINFERFHIFILMNSVYFPNNEFPKYLRAQYVMATPRLGRGERGEGGVLWPMTSSDLKFRKTIDVQSS